MLQGFACPHPPNPACRPCRAHCLAGLPPHAARRLPRARLLVLATPPPDQIWRSYYPGGTLRVQNGFESTTALYYTLGDHLGSTSVTTDENGGFYSQLLYTPFGETRYASGETPTNYRYTGQREEAGLGLYFYNARWYDPALGRFIQADSIVPGVGNVLAYDRYAGMMNNPVKYTDPTGHIACDELGTEVCNQRLDANGNVVTYYTNEDFVDVANDNFAVLRYIAARILIFFDRNDDLEAFARIVEVADGLYDKNDQNGFLDGLTRVITGASYTTGNIQEAFMYRNVRDQNRDDEAIGMDLRCVAVGRRCDQDGDGEYDLPLLESSGWRFAFADGGNQAFHFWSAFVSAVEHPWLGLLLTTVGNVYHEYIQPLQTGNNRGASVQDFALTQVGISLGMEYGFGNIPRNQLADVFRAIFRKGR
ncbi:MAG: RHS repeat-associated core domain-containing protein [Anaerolineales bacterium]